MHWKHRLLFDISICYSFENPGSISFTSLLILHLVHCSVKVFLLIGGIEPIGDVKK